ncbi:MAG: DNA translocase FtsK, partial [Planctomycetota bacterium]
RAPTEEPVEEAEANLPSEPVTHESTEGPVEDTPLHDGVDLDLEGGDVALDDSAPEDAPDVEVDRGGASREAPPEDAGAALRGESAPPEEEGDEAVADAFVEPVAEPAAHAERSEPEPIEPIVELIPQPRAAPSASSPAVDPALVEEAVELVVAYRRASANFLKRRLRVGDDEAMALLRVLAERGVIDCEVGATQGRLRGD